MVCSFFFNDTATTEIYTLSLHDALPICRELAGTVGLDPLCFKAECVKSLIEITTPPSPDLMNLTDAYLNNLALALEVASELGLELYPLGNYPLATRPELRDDPSTRVQALTIGPDTFLHAGRCAGTHLHLESPAGTAWPDVKAALGASRSEEHTSELQSRQYLVCRL